MATDIPATERHALTALFERQRSRAGDLRTTSATERIDRLRSLAAAIRSHRGALQEALYTDLRKSPESVDKTEILPVSFEVSHAIRNVRRWMKPRRLPTPVYLAGTSSHVRFEPKGTGLILAPWNYPLTLTVGPLISAVSAGCTAIVKPSEHTPASSSVVRDLVAAALPADEAMVVDGDADLARALLELPFDHVYFTGSTEVGRHVMRAAAEHLSSITLELGGKSPTVVDASAPVDHAARVIAFSKFSNSGQTCIAPDHVYVHEAVYDRFVEALRKHVHACFGSTASARRGSPAFGGLIHDGHADRLRVMVREAVDGGAVAHVGDPEASSDRFVDALVLGDIPAGARVMEEEIFGPVLPLIRFRTLDDVTADINSRPKPLAMYVFATRTTVVDHLSARTSAGSTVVNDAMIHFVSPHLPFGGVGRSGMGRGHGEAGFRAFSNERVVLRQHLRPGLLTLLYPPYTRWTRRLLATLRRLY